MVIYPSLKLGNKVRTLALIAVLTVPAIVAAQGLNVPVVPFAGTSRSPLVQAIGTLINIFLSLAAFAAAIMLVYGGIRYLISQGDEDEAKLGKRIILYAIIGLIIIGLSAAVVNYVIGAIANT